MNPRVLVVDDVAAMAEQYAYDLRRLGGYRTRVATSGKEALAALVEEDVDCVILDLEMPGMDGFELTEAVRAAPAARQVPVVILSSRGGEEDRRRGMQAGADSYLVKSAFDEHALLSAVGRLLGDQEPAP